MTSYYSVGVPSMTAFNVLGCISGGVIVVIALIAIVAWWKARSR